MTATSTRYYENIYWSWRRHLKASLPSVKRFYNPASQPMPRSDVDSWIIFFTGGYEAMRFARSNPRILCVAREDDDRADLDGLVGDVVEACGPTHVSRFITLYDKTTALAVGQIEIVDVSVREAVPYDTGISSKAIDFFTRFKTKRNR